MQNPETELDSLVNLARATVKAFADLQVVHSDVLRFLHKLHDMATCEDPLQDGYQTRLDADLQRELDLILATTTDEPTKETRPD